MVHIDHSFGPVRAKVKEDWLEFYVDYVTLAKLLEKVQKITLPDRILGRGYSTTMSPGGHRNKQWRSILLRVLMPLIPRGPVTPGRRGSTAGPGSADHSDINLPDLDWTDTGSRRFSTIECSGPTLSSFRSKSADDLIKETINDMESGKVIFDERQVLV